VIYRCTQEPHILPCFPSRPQSGSPRDLAPNRIQFEIATRYMTCARSDADKTRRLSLETSAAETFDAYLSATSLSSCRTRLSSFSIALLSCSIARLTLSPRTSELLLSRARRPYIAAFCKLMARLAPCEFLCKR
jgi:hypothetical protein